MRTKDEETVRDAVAVERAVADDDTLRVQLHEEVLEPVWREVELGRVGIVRRVETAPVEKEVKLSRDQLHVERVPIGQVVEVAPRMRYEGETLIIPIVEEEVVVTKQIVVREELRVTRQTTTETRKIAAEVRREVVDFDERPAATSRVEVAASVEATPAPAASPS